MEDGTVKGQLGARIAALRRQKGLTQLELAERLNYSDKAVSKWERGESVPDVSTLVALAAVFGTTVDGLLGTQEPNDRKPARKRADRRVILGLSVVLVWFVALLIFVVLSSIRIEGSWVAFFYALPVSAIVLLSIRSAWRHFGWNRVLISVLMWGTLLAIHVTLVEFLNFNMWKLYLLGIPGQIAICLWFRLFRPDHEKEETHE